MRTMTPLVAPSDPDAIAPPPMDPAPRARRRLLGLVLEAFRYLGASVAALALDAGLLWLLVARLHWAPWLGGAVAYGAGLALIYVISVRWVFATRAVNDHRVEFVLFAALGVVGLVLNSVVLTIAIDAGASLVTAKAVAAAIGFASNFASRKVLLFHVHRRWRS